jgi:MoxR-like ATPase
VADLESVTAPAELLELQESVRGIYVDPLIKEYIVRIVDATRKTEMLTVGASPRGTLALFKGIQARTVLEGRDYALPEDVKALVKPVLGHRVILSPTARVAEATVNDVLEEVVQSVAVPGAAGVAKAAGNNRPWFRG